MTDTDIPKLVRFKELTREEWGRIARLRQADSDPRQPHSEDWYTFETFQACASREQHLEAAKEEARREREHGSDGDECSPPEDPPADCA